MTQSTKKRTATRDRSPTAQTAHQEAIRPHESTNSQLVSSRPGGDHLIRHFASIARRTSTRRQSSKPLSVSTCELKHILKIVNIQVPKSNVLILQTFYSQSRLLTLTFHVGNSTCSSTPLRNS